MRASVRPLSVEGAVYTQASSKKFGESAARISRLAAIAESRERGLHQIYRNLVDALMKMA
jgi:hypothetical protein